MFAKLQEWELRRIRNAFLCPSQFCTISSLLIFVPSRWYVPGHGHYRYLDNYKSVFSVIASGCNESSECDVRIENKDMDGNAYCETEKEQIQRQQAAAV